MTVAHVIKLDLENRPYDILVGEGCLAEAGRLLEPVLRPSKAIILTDDNVEPLYAERLIKSLKSVNIHCSKLVAVPHGEASKSFATIEKIANEILESGIDRSTVLIALGGGVVGDLAGFSASVLLRGIDFVQIPTTLLAQVDSSVGGKTGINTPMGKNLVGTFWQPKMVIIDTDTLKTLPRRELLAGYAEIVKYGLINDAGFFYWLEENAQGLLAGDADLQKQAIAVSCRAKAGIVKQDEKETGGIRALLNLGHSFGHALEALAGYDGSLLHGEAVAIGMVMAFDFSVQQGLCPVEDALRVKKHLMTAGLPIAKPESANPVAMLDYMKHDKKAQNGQIKLVLARGIGKAFSGASVDDADLLGFLKELG